MAIATALFCMIATGVPARAQAGLAGTPLHVCVMRDTGREDPALLLRQPWRFDCATPQEKMGGGDFWVLSAPIGTRSTPTTPLRVRVASLWQKQLDLFALYADGHVASQFADSRALSRHVQLGAIIEYALPAHDAPLVRVLWHVRGSANVRGILVGAQLATAHQSEQANLMMAAIYGAFGGLGLALLVYNFALWRALRYDFQLVYCVMVALLLSYTLTSSGTLAWLLPGIDNNDRLRINYLLLGGFGASALMFARSFFEARIFTGWLGSITHIVAGSLVAAGLLFFFFAPFNITASDATFAYTFLGIGAVMLPTIWRACRLRSNYLWLFAMTWAAPIIMAFLREAANVHLIPWSFWIDNSTILATAAEALLSAVAIAYRIRLLSNERDLAVANETIARRLAETDPLTGLLNRRAFLERAIGREGEQLLLIADLDHFKHVNETLGHDGGDEVLRVFARVLRSCVPSGALIARLGGEEFAIITHCGEPVEADELLRKLRATRMPFDCTVTASIGACTGPLASETDWKKLYRGADTALFDAKASGRDRARVRHLAA